MNIIQVKNLVKEFPGTVAVNDISFDVKKGEIFGILGPNGAGKTTTVKILSTLLEPTKGEAIVNGYNTSKNQSEVRKSIGLVFQESALDGWLTAKENMEFHGRMYNETKEKVKKRINELLELVGLSEEKDQVVKNFSGGMKRRLEIARGLLHEPKILFLDEPTLGLDAHARREMWYYIEKLSKNDVTIILTTHYMEEADFLCDRVAIMDEGKIIKLDAPKKLKDDLGGDIINIQVSKDVNRLAEKIKKFNKIKKVEKHDSNLFITVPYGEKYIPKIIEKIKEEGIELLSVNLHKPSLEDVFLDITGRRMEEAHESN